MWRHGGHVGVQNNSGKSLLGIWFYYYEKLERHYAIVLHTNMAVSSREWKPRIAKFKGGRANKHFVRTETISLCMGKNVFVLEAKLWTKSSKILSLGAVFVPKRALRLFIIWVVRPRVHFHCKTIEKIPVWGLAVRDGASRAGKTVRPC